MIFKDFLDTCINDKVCRIYSLGIIITSVICLSLILWWMNCIYTPMIPRVPNAKSVNIIFTQGTSVKFFANRLNNANILKHPDAFVFLAHVLGASRSLHAGEYQITPGLSASGLLDKMIRGEVINHTFTIIEGWTFAQIIAALNGNAYLQHTITNLNNDQIMQYIGYEGLQPEGRFAPDTYLFSGATKDIDILRTAYSLMQKRVNTEWQNRDINADISCEYKTIIIASMVEKESAFLPERPLIAGVILKRLQLNMPLQIDSTIIYGLGKNHSGKLTPQDMQLNTAYNSYTNRGLPPTPICMPSLNAIHAALHPEFTNALYFVAKGDGSHEFSATLQEHDAAIKKYLQ